jgi:hypothetical protein
MNQALHGLSRIARRARVRFDGWEAPERGYRQSKPANPRCSGRAGMRRARGYEALTGVLLCRRFPAKSQPAAELIR